MRITNWQSISGTIARLLPVFWWIMLALMIIGIPLETAALFLDPPESSVLFRMLGIFEISSQTHRTAGYKVLMIVQTMVVAPVILILIRRLRSLFANFSRNELFVRENIFLLDRIAKLILILSLASLNLLSFCIGVVSWILVAIFRQGTELQEEMDYTV